MFILHPSHFLPPKGHRARHLAVGFLVLAPFLFGALALALGQDANWDLRNYHFYNAYAFLNDRYAQDLLPSQTPYFYNPLMDVPFFWLATHAPAKIAGFTLGFVQGLNFILLFMIAHATLIVPNPRHKAIICAGLAALGMLGGGGIAQIGTTFGDNITSLGILLSAALIVRHLERLSVDAVGRACGLAFLFALPAGMMMGLKLPAVIYCVGLCGGFLFSGGTWKRRLLLGFVFGLGILVGIAITLGHWAYFLQTHFGSPLFPYFNDIFHSPLAPDSSARDMQYVPRSLHDAVLMPFIFADSPFRVGEIPWRDWRIPILYALLPVAVALRLFFGRNRKPVDAVADSYAARYLLGAFALSYAVWLVMFTIYRYAVTLEMVTPLLIVFAVGMLPLKLATRGLMIGFVLAVISASIHPGNWGRRSVWLDSFISAPVPADIGDTSHLMILMAGIEPYSHLVPSFPPQVSFVRIQSNFASPEQDKGINKLLHDRIDAHRAAKGRFMMLIPAWQHQVADDALSFFGLKLAPQACFSLIDRLYDNKEMSLCGVISRESGEPF